MSSSFVIHFAFAILFTCFLSVPSSSYVIVSKDGSGDHYTISDAIKAAPTGSKVKHVIFIREGVYKEHVEIPKEKINITLIGEGSAKTKIFDTRSHAGGFSTFQSATLDVQGDYFMAIDLSVINGAGPSAGQAVAVKSDSLRSVFYRCSIEGYQDTLYIRALGQFYRDCNISGTVDFIFGTGGGAVLQNCNIYGRKPDGNTITVTADGRSAPKPYEGIILHGCSILATPELKVTNGTVSSYLGRPWGSYSRTVIMQSFMESFISARGWLEWTPGYEVTLYYAEYNNTGLGASTDGRVGWPGYRVLKAVEEALPFTVDMFINGSDWLPSTGVPFVSGLL